MFSVCCICVVCACVAGPFFVHCGLSGLLSHR